MAFKFIAILTLATVASAGYIQPQHQFYQAAPRTNLHQAPISSQHLQGTEQKNEEYNSHPQYQFSYNVDDSLTGDSKSQSETRNGDVVEGEYSLIDSDGFKRIVRYTADSEHGFNAVVTRVPLNGPHDAYHHDVAVKNEHQTYAYTAPAVQKTVQPVEYASSPSFYKPKLAPKVSQEVVSASSYAAPNLNKPQAVAYFSPSVSKAAPVLLTQQNRFFEGAANPSLYSGKQNTFKSDEHY